MRKERPEEARKALLRLIVANKTPTATLTIRYNNAT
jgi:hypothetical protein